MTNEERQRALLMAQLSKKRTLKQKYLRPREAPEHPLTGLVMTNVMLLAIKEKSDIFGAIRRLRLEAPSAEELSFNTVLGWLEVLADVLGCGVYELFIDDRARRQRILDKLLRSLSACDSWEDIRVDEGGSGSFALPGFDYAYRMAARPSAALLFEKTALSEKAFRYTLTVTDGSTAAEPIPGRAVLWQENQGPLQEFTDRVLADFDSEWPALMERFDQLSRRIAARAETLRDLARLLAEAPAGLDVAPLLKKESDLLKALREEGQAAYLQMPDRLKAGGRGTRARNTLILLGGAASALERLIQAAPEAPQEALTEIACMLESAGSPI